MMSKTSILQKMKEQDWVAVREWLGDFDIYQLNYKITLINHHESDFI